jgi:hypothetical protein
MTATMNKTFKQLREALATLPTKKHVPRPPESGKVSIAKAPASIHGTASRNSKVGYTDDEEYPELKPHAKGEQEFQLKHTTAVTNDPENAHGTVFNAPTTSRNKLVPGLPGERPPVAQGTSQLKDPEKGFKGSQTTPNRGDKRQGDMKPVRLSKSSVDATQKLPPRAAQKPYAVFKTKPTIYGESVETVVEDVAAQLKKIASSNSAGSVKFADGDSANINPASAKKLLDTHSKLNPDNAKKFRETINKSPAGLLKMMKFTAGGSK